jgi:CRP-like cAMP-binding protein
MTMSLPALYRIVFGSNAWFDDLPDEIRQNMLARMRHRILAPGQRLYDRGDPAEGCYRVLEGCVRLSGASRDGRETLLDFYGPGTWFGDISAFDGLPRVHDIHAYAEPTALLQIATRDMEELQAAHPALTRAFLRFVALRTRILLVALESYSTQTMEQRLANRLLMLAVSFGATTPEGLRIKLHLPQEILARLIGTTRQRVSQIFKKWELDGLVEHRYGDILLRDRMSLEDLAEA